MAPSLTQTLSLNDRHRIIMCCVLFVASVLAAFPAVNNIKISPDSMRYALISQEILSGNGIRVPIIRLEDPYVPVNGAIPFLDNMPLLPILFSLLGGVSVNNYLAAQIINVLSHAAISIFAFLIVINLGVNRYVALLAGITIPFSYPLLRVTHHISSEPLLIALTTAALYFLTLSRKTNATRRGMILCAAGVCASAAILARNAGIALIPVFFWEALVLIKNRRAESGWVSSALGLTLPVFTTGGMFLRNYLVAGTLRGFNQASPERSLWDASAGTVVMIFEQFHLGRNAVLPVILAGIFSVAYILFHDDLRKEILNSVHKGFDSIIFFILGYTALICLTMAKVQWRYEVRYVSPLVPFLFIATFLLVVVLWGKKREGKVSVFSLTGMIISLTILASGSLYKTYLSFPEFSYKQIKQYSLLHNGTYKWIKKEYGENTIITTNEPFHLSFFGGYSTVSIPHKMFNPTNRIPEDMEFVLPRQMRKFDSPVLVLFEPVQDKYDGKYITDLFYRRADNNAFELAYEGQDGVVYRLKEQ